MTSISKHDLISRVVSLIRSEDYESSIKNISGSLQIPVPYIRKTILTLMDNHVLHDCIYALDDGEEDSSFIEEYQNNPEAITQKFLAGHYDEKVLGIDLNILDNDESVLLPLTHLEYSALKSLGENVLSLKREAIFEKKDTLNPLSVNIKSYRDTLLKAISQKKAITFRYTKQDKTTKQYIKEYVTCFPQDIITNINDNWLYMQSTEQKLYRLDNMLPPCQIITKSPPFPGVSVNPYQKYKWGVYSNSADEPVHVKLRIAPETPNIISKIQRDTALRSVTCKLYSEGEYYYYEDNIIGLKEFQRWLRGYGSSIVVLEPKSLRNEIIDRAQEALSRYALSQTWGNL